MWKSRKTGQINACQKNLNVVSVMQGWYCLLSASGPYYHCLHKHAKHWSELELCCLWLCVPALGGSLWECLFHGMFGHSVGKPPAHCHLLFPPLWYQMWLWCLQSAGEPPSGKYRPVLCAAYEGYMQRWKEICWLGNLSPSPVTRVTICYLCDRAFWFAQPLNASVS